MLMVFEGGAFGRRLGHEDRALMHGICVLIKEAFHHMRIQQEDGYP